MRLLVLHERDEVRAAIAQAAEGASIASSLEEAASSPVCAALGGPGAFAAFREAGPLKDVPKLLLIERDGDGTVDELRRAGAFDLVHLPLRPAELRARLHAAGEMKRQLDECRRHSAELERLGKEFQALSAIDELTGVANRRWFNRTVEQEWARAVREQAAVSLILLDVDHFKTYNDHYGHQRGDDCLRRVASALSAGAKRPGDQVARYGGEEFAVLLPRTGLEGAVAVAESLRSRVEALGLEHPAAPTPGRVTVSAGVASRLPGRQGTADALIGAADRAIYQAKREGR
ncbi:MAG: diguanylate cyclase, partial [Thermoleophilia bacterium]|nr:diguanylate cyclase [Thermoleophilia bacterium]